MISSSTNVIADSYGTPPKSVRVTDPQTGVEHIAYYGYAYDASSESLKPTSTYGFMKALAQTYDPSNMSENDLSAMADMLTQEGFLQNSDAEKMKLSYNDLSQSLHLTDTKIDSNQTVDLLSLYKGMQSKLGDNQTTQANILATKIDALQVLENIQKNRPTDIHAEKVSLDSLWG